MISIWLRYNRIYELFSKRVINLLRKICRIMKSWRRKC